MKKIIFILAICFVAAPAFAEVDVYLDYNDVAKTVSVKYTGATPTVKSGMPRAFALDLTIDSPGTFTDIRGYKNDWVHDACGPDEIGESNSLYPGYGIYPARIAIDSTGDVNRWGTPLADDINDPGAGDGLDSQHIVLEFGSLYYGDVNAPLSAGTLCVLDIGNCGDAPSTGYDVTMTDEDDFRGGLVFEDGSPGVVEANVAVCVSEGPPPTCRDMFTTEEQALYDKYVTAGKDPTCWCNQYQCRGDADNAEQDVFIVGTMRIYQNDLNILIPSWKKKPETGADPRADFDHAEQDVFIVGTMSIYQNDLNILIPNWKATTESLDECPSYIAP